MSSSAAQATATRIFSVAVIGNPNTGKTTLFNALTGLNQHVGNYPGVTVERKVGTLQLDSETRINLIDLPGTYSLAARSPDEMIAVDVLLGQQQGAEKIDAILAIADGSNPERNFYLISQLCELGLPVVIALNMMDVAQTKGISIDVEKLSATLGVPVVAICANKGKGLPELRAVLKQTVLDPKVPAGPLPHFTDAMSAEIDALRADLSREGNKLKRDVNRLEAFRVLVDKGGYAETRLEKVLGPAFRLNLEAHRQRASKNPLQAEEVRVRYAWVKQVLADSLKRPASPPPTHSDAIDKVLTHWFSGTAVFALLMLLVFQAIFRWARPLMDGIQSLFEMLGSFVSSHMAEGALRSLVVSGVINGVGGVLVFLPQICILFFFIAILEDCGYMARAAFLMDRLLSKVGLSGKSFIPMLSSFACAVPGVMAARTIENPRDRLTTILVAPLMSCSARLPVYTILINAFVPDTSFGFGWLSLHGLTLFAMYGVGIVVAVPVAWLLKKTLLKGETPPFLIELPSYKFPDTRSVILRVFDRGKAFTVRAGTIILAVSIVVWALAYFPHSPEIAARFDAQRKALKKENREKLASQIAPIALADLENNKSEVGLILAQAAAIDAVRKKALDEKGITEPVEAPAEMTPEQKEIEDQTGRLTAELQKSSATLWPMVLEIRAQDMALADGTAGLDKAEAGQYLRESYFGRMGHSVESVFKPLGWDWRIAMAAIASFPAREVIVATLGTVFNLGSEENEESAGLRSALRGATWDGSSRKLFNVPVALSIMVFFALCSQCAATLATIRRETNTWRWPLFSFTYMTVLAYFAAMIVYQAGMYAGWDKL